MKLASPFQHYMAWVSLQPHDGLDVKLASPFQHYMAWVSLQPHDGLDVIKLVPTPAFRSPIRQFRLFDGGDILPAIELLELDNAATWTVTVSRDLSATHTSR